MARIPDLKRIAKEDFNSDDRNLVGKLALPINSFHEQVRNALNGNIDFTNLNQETITLSITVDANGIPVTDTKFKSNLKTTVKGTTCIRAFNLTTATNYPISQPFINFTENNHILTINHVTGLQANEKYNLTLILIG